MSGRPRKGGGLQHIPVIDHDSRPMGLLIARDVFAERLEEVKYEERLLRDYVMTVGYR